MRTLKPKRSVPWRRRRRRFEPPEAGLAHTILTIASPLALLTAVLYYFGWVRTRVQAAALGFDSGVLNLSTTDYLLKSVNVLFPFIAVVLLAAVAARAAYGAWTHHVDRARLIRRARLVPYAAGACVVAGLLLLVVPGISEVSLPVGLTAAVLLTMAGRDLRRRATRADPWSAGGRALALALLAMLLFWDTERVARFMGEQFAADYRANPQQFAAVTLYSRNDLKLSASGVQADALPGADGDYRFRYRGLRLMERSSDRYVLINTDWSAGNGRVVVLVENDGLRIEFGAVAGGAPAGRGTTGAGPGQGMTWTIPQST